MHISDSSDSWWPFQGTQFRVMIYYKTQDQHKSYRVNIFVVPDDEEKVEVSCCNLAVMMLVRNINHSAGA